MTSTSEARPRKGFFGWIRAVDDGVFAVEQAIVALALIAITVLMFVNVLARRIEAPDSKVGAMIAGLAGVTDHETRLRIDADVAPWVTAATSLGLIVFGYYTWRRFVARRAGAAPPRVGPTLGVGALVALAIVAACWGAARLFLELDSATVFATIFGAACVGYVANIVWKRPAGWVIKAPVGLAVGALAVWFCLRWFPIGYTWTFKVSLMLLLWVGLLGASVCAHEGKHIRLEALGKLAPARARPFLVALGFVVASSFCAAMTWLGVIYTFEPTASNDPELPELITLFGTRYVAGLSGAYGLDGRVEGTDIPDWIGTLSVIVGFALATLRFLGAAVSAALGGDYGAPAPEEELEKARRGAEAAGAAPESGT